MRYWRITAVAALLGVLAVAWLTHRARAVAPGLKSLAQRPPHTTAFIEIRRREARQKKRLFKPNYQWVSIAQISPELVRAVLAAEDEGFFRHNGFEWALLRQAAWRELKSRRRQRGASTITQQLAKNLYLYPKKSYWRKLREALIVWRMERLLRKRRILELYLNVVEWGDGVFGAEAAAQTYFGKSALELARDEAVALAAVLPGPRRHSPLDNSRWLESRKAWVERRLEESGWSDRQFPFKT